MSFGKFASKPMKNIKPTKAHGKKPFSSRTVIGIICIVLALLITFGVAPLVNRFTDQKVEIIRLKADVARGQIITADHIETVKVGLYNLPDKVIKDSKSVVGKYAATDLYVGDYLFDSKLSSDNKSADDVLLGLGGKKVAISVNISDFAAGLSDKLENGDIVSVIIYDKENDISYTPATLKYVKVITTTTSDGIDKDEIASLLYSQTPDTRFESEAPGSYYNVTAPAESTEKATWTMWEYENGTFVLKYYGVQISSSSPEIVPSADCMTAVYENGKWTIRSGYGVTIDYYPTISTVSEHLRPENNAYTSVQYVLATFPEYRYYDADGNCRTLEFVNGSYQFIENTDADGNARVHFIPVFVEDGNYIISVKVSQVWTPIGMITATRSTNVIVIDGTIYDDWYQG